ncbi:MAG: PLP-dependent aminotransferase family protein [Tepidisphaeraceae bacterium]
MPNFETVVVADDSRHAAIARHLAAMIDAGTLRPGDKVPSVRQTAKLHGVAVGTVLHAFRVLEADGRIVARPQSGYYVRAVAKPLPEPKGSTPSRRAERPTVAQMVIRMSELSVPDVVPLGMASPSPDCLPTKHLSRISAAIGRKTGRGYDSYDEPPGCRELRVQIARQYMDVGCGIGPDDILTTCGCQEALALCLRAVGKPGGVVAIDSPAYFGHLQTIELLGMKAVELPTDPRTGVDLAALGKLLATNKKVTACLVGTNVHNPLGFVMPDENKRKLVELLAEYDVPFIEDDAYGDLAFGDTRPGVCKSYDTAGRVLLCSSFSKTLSPGARVGWCAPGRYMEQIKRLKFCSTVATPSLPQLAIADFLAGGHYTRHLRKLRATYETRVRTMGDLICRHFPAGTRATRPVGGHVLWVELPGHVDSVKLFEAAGAEKISIAPGPMFSSGNGYRNCVRINCSAPIDARVEAAIATLARLMSGPLPR